MPGETTHCWKYPKLKCAAETGGGEHGATGADGLLSEGVAISSTSDCPAGPNGICRRSLTLLLYEEAEETFVHRS